MPFKLIAAIVGLCIFMPSVVSALTPQADDPLIIMLKGGVPNASSTTNATGEKPARGLSVKAKAAIGFALNYFVGFGVGSFVQGDTASGVTIVLMEGLGLTSIVTGYLISGIQVYSLSTMQNSQSSSLTAFHTGIICMGAGYAVYLVGNVVGLIAPWTYAKRAHLTQDQLDTPAIANAPELSPFVSLAAVDGQIGPVIGLSLSL